MTFRQAKKIKVGDYVWVYDHNPNNNSDTPLAAVVTAIGSLTDNNPFLIGKISQIRIVFQVFVRLPSTQGRITKTVQHLDLANPSIFGDAKTKFLTVGGS